MHLGKAAPLRRSSYSLFALAPMAAMVLAQAPSPSHDAPKKRATSVQAAASPVTRAEMAATIYRSDSTLSKLLGLKFSPRLKTRQGAATRDEIIEQFDRIFTKAKPCFDFMPIPVEPNVKLFVFKTPKSRLLAARLVRYGCVDQVGPLVTGPKPTIGPKEYAEALGRFMARICELTHRHSSEYSPTLMKAEP